MSVWFLLFLSVACVVVGYPSGAPNTACRHFTPKHPGASLQASPSPYVIQPQVTRLAQGDSLLVTISSQQGLPYEGFMMQARNPLAVGEPLGSFTLVPQNAKTINCTRGVMDTVTHESKAKKTSLNFEWQPPADYIGTVVFNGTVLQDYSTYWVGVQSEPVQVVKRSLVDSSGGQSAGISTTRRPKTTTPSPTPQTGVTETDRVTKDALTEGCDSLKTCFGFPTNCIDAGNCKAVVACQMKSDVCVFEMRAAASAYVAVGLSQNEKMELASVVECVVKSPGGVAISGSWNGPGYVNTLLTTSTEAHGVRLLASSFDAGVVYCKFERDAVTNVSNTIFDLTNNDYFLLLAAGNSPPKPGSAISYHDVGREGSSQALNLGQGGQVGSASKLLLRLHAGFMVTAWIGAASIGILLARYFKQTWVGNQLCGKDQWFAWHRFFMVLTWSLTVAGFVLIWVELKAWSAADNPHAILGTVTTALAFIQPFMAALRPAPTASRRPLFNWAHWFVGNAAHILAIVTIFFATRLAKAEVPSWLDWVLVSYVSFHVVMHLVFSIVGCASEKQNVKRVSSFPMKEMNSSRNPLSAAERSLDAPHSGLRKGLLGIYLTIVLLLTIGIVVIVAAAPIGENITKLQKIILP